MKRSAPQNRLVMILTVLLSLSLAGNVLSAGDLVDISAQLNSGIKVMLHGKAFEPIDAATGTRYVPITYNGRTYLPLRAVAEAVGLKVNYDATTNTAYLGEVEGNIVGQISWITASPEYSYGNNSYRIGSRTPAELTALNGKVFTTGYVPNGNGIYVNFASEYSFKKFKATIWPDHSYMVGDDGYGESGTSALVEIKDHNNILIKSFRAPWRQVMEFEVDVADAKSFTVEVEGDMSILGEPQLGK